MKSVTWKHVEINELHFHQGREKKIKKSRHGIQETILITRGHSFPTTLGMFTSSIPESSSVRRNRGVKRNAKWLRRIVGDTFSEIKK